MDKELNRESISFQLREAQEAIATLLEDLADPEEQDYDEERFTIDMTHIYHHINSAFNTRFAREDYYETMTQEEFDQNERFPTDIILFPQRENM